MRRILSSLQHALRGLSHTLLTERNLRMFCAAYVLVLAAALLLKITPAEWLILVIAGGTFVAMELINTALERFVDAFDDERRRHHGVSSHLGLRATKDIASAASLVSLCTTAIVVISVFAQHWNTLIALGGGAF